MGLSKSIYQLPLLVLVDPHILCSHAVHKIEYSKADGLKVLKALGDSMQSIFICAFFVFVAILLTWYLLFDQMWKFVKGEHQSLVITYKRGAK